RQKIWMIILTILTVIGILAAVPGVMFGTYMAAFAADAPGTPADSVVNLMIGVWVVGFVYVLLLIAGVVGGWIAYRKRRIGLSLGLSLLAAVPMFLIVAGFIALFVVNAVWTASL
ncbi:MAG TPA: hypothetical protein VFH29_06870, partial [Anaerolineales bacterium]|nr:hypothetical protein [Anaerolineales bacterium]